MRTFLLVYLKAKIKSLTLLVLLIHCGLNLSAQIKLVNEGSVWNYYDLGNPGTTWSSNSFDDSGWASGNAQLGYGDGDENTLLSFGGDANNKHITTYFRKEVILPYIGDLTCRVKIDDGAVAYFNGVEVFRDNLPSGIIGHETLATYGWVNEDNWHTFSVPKAMISNVINYFSVEVHQSGASSSDLSFDFDLEIEEIPPLPNIYINEIMASNSQTLEDSNGESSDWIELYNAFNTTIDLNGYYLTDDKDDLTQSQIDYSVIINPSGHVLFWASGDAFNGTNHLDFKLSSSGEWLGLVAPDGLTILDSITFSNQRKDVAYGRERDGYIDFKYLLPASPLQNNVNSTAYLGFLKEPTFSADAGFFDTDFDLVLSPNDVGASVVYTLDGSEPRSQNINSTQYPYKLSYPKNPTDPYGSLLSGSYRSFSYDNPIGIKDNTAEPNGISQITQEISFYGPSLGYQVEKANIVKARAERNGYIPSDVVTNSYFKKVNGTKKYNLPYISLSFSENEMYDYYSGIGVPGVDFDNYRASDQTTTDFLPLYVGNFYRSGRANEIKGHAEYFVNESKGISQNIGVRVHGNRSRHWTQKSVRLYARSEYGESNMEYPIFEKNDYEKHKNLILRNGGNDFFFTHFRDAVLQDAVSHLKFETQAFQPSVLYMNGEYWGLVNIRERLDDNYFEIKYGIPSDSIDILENNAIVNAGSNTNYNSLLSFIQSNDLSQSINYNQILEKVDVENFIDYQSSEIFYGNQDWPGNNILFWRKKVPFSPEAGLHDGRWRWGMYDIDNSAGSLWNSDISPSFNALQNATGSTQWYSKILYELLKNEEFKHDFIIRNADLLNSSFKSEYINNLINLEIERIDTAMLDHINRWKRPLEYYGDAITTNYWLQQVSNMKNWLTERGDFNKLHIKQKFGLSGDTEIILEVSNDAHGYIKMNTIDVLGTTPGINENPYPWTGKYFKGVENKLIAMPNLGFKFTHWIVDGQQFNTDTLLINTQQSSVNIKCFFEEDILSENPSPLAYILSDCIYTFEKWDEDNIAGTYPKSVKFVYMETVDPDISASITDSTYGEYNLDTRTRINGLGEEGVAFINTGNTGGNIGYPGTRLGGLLLAINTENVNEIKLSWKGRTINAGDREYAIRLQYRIGDIAEFTNFLDGASLPVEYQRQSSDGDSLVFENISLPESLLGKPYVQIFWRYYNVYDPGSGSRDQLAIDDIRLETTRNLANDEINTLNSNYGIINSSANQNTTTNEAYIAQKAIYLSPGFRTNSNLSVFEAKIEGCVEQ